jgi:hypothetical protein
MSEMKVAVEAAGQESAAASEEPMPGSVLDWLATGMKQLSGALKKLTVDSLAEDEDTDSLPGLTAQQEKLRRLLLKLGEELSGDLAVLPDIEPDLLTTARKQCRAAPEDRILAVLDFGDGGDRGLLFGCAGLYWRNGDDTPHEGTGALRYAELAERRIVSHGNVVYLGKDQFLCPNPDETGIDCEELVRMLSRVQKMLAPRPA